MSRYIDYPVCPICSGSRKHPEGAPHLIDGQYFEVIGAELKPLDRDTAKAEHRRASVRAAVQRFRTKPEAPSLPEPAYAQA